MRLRNSLSLFLGFSLLFTACKQEEKHLFSILPSRATGITFTNKLEKHKLFSILYYLYYYNGGGVATGDINNDGLPDIYLTANNRGGNKLYLNKGDFKFEDITHTAGVAGTSDWATGVTMADVNGDGWLDIYVSTVSNKYELKGHNELFINQGNGTFKELSAQYGLNTSCFTTQSAFFDYDGDGDLDCYILNQSHRPHANIVDTSNRRKYDALSGDRLYRNDVNTSGKFTDVSAEAGISQSALGYGLGLAIGDLNNDGWDDIYVGNDFHENDYYYVNNGNGTFTESGAQHFRHYSRFSMGNDMADYDNDGQLDVITVDMLPPDEKTLKTYGSDENPDIYTFKLTNNGYQHQVSRNVLQRNNGDGKSFSDVALITGISSTDWSWSALFADFDNSGRKDLFISNGIVKRPVDLDYIKYASDLKMKGMDATDKFDDDAINAMPGGASHPYFFAAKNDLSFTDVSNEWGVGKMNGFYNGAAYADLDNDGDLDLIINSIEEEAQVLRNNKEGGHSIRFSFQGQGLNRFAIGAKVYLFHKGTIQYQQVMATRGFQSASDTRLHFGLDSLTAIDSAWVIWPNDKMQKLGSLPADKAVVLDEKNAIETYDGRRPGAQKEFFTQLNGDAAGWQHKENNFIDFNVQYLIPHAMSTRGPKIAVADINGDGLDDYYACGTKQQPGAVMIQQADGRFIKSSVDSLFRRPSSEDVDAMFFDINKDGFPDLYVVSGGNEDRDNEPGLNDRLFINDGSGRFKNASATLPWNLTNKSAIAVADYDHDGDLDILVGGLANARQYGVAQSAYLYANDGKGNFKLAPDGEQKPFLNIGMITSVNFTDINNDTWPDAVITGEWMPVKILINNNGKFSSTDIPASTGLWQTIFPADVNGDGKIDLLAGNWGHNTKFYENKSGPLKLYVKDFDRNGSIDQILTYQIEGKEYTFLAKDELERQMPALKKAYLKYQEVAGQTVQYLMDDLFKDYIELKAEVLGSSCFINEGNGNFRRVDLPNHLQLAPIFSFQAVKGAGSGENRYIAAGNFFDVGPYEGRYDAQPLAMFDVNKDASFTFINQTNLASVPGQFRDLKWLRTASGEVLMAARNNDAPVLFRYTD